MRSAKKITIKILSLLLAIPLLTLFVSCQKDSTVTHKYCEIEITLPDRFSEYEAESFDLALTDTRLIVGIQRLSFDAGLEDNVPATLTPLVFREYYLNRTGTTAELSTHGYIPLASFTLSASGVTYSYLLSFYRTDYAYFIITFITEGGMTESLKEDVYSYIDTVIYTS